MKRVRFAVKALMLSMMVCFLSCTDVTNESYPTKAIDSLEVTARSYSGVNIITWKAVKDARAYSIYRTADGKNGENLVLDNSKQTFYVDNDVEAASSYKYRVIAHPLDSTVHDAAQREVNLTTPKVATDSSNKKGTWAPANTSFSGLAQYESDYNPADTVLSAGTIQASLLTSSGSKIRVKFPVKPYASYTVKIGQPNGALLDSSLTIDNGITINGFDYAETATVDLTAVYSGEKEVTVVAEPYGMRYSSFTVAASSKVTVASYDAIDSAVVGNISVEWTNYYSWSKTAYSRIRFVPASLQGKDFAPSEYKIYRAVINTSGETISSVGKNVYGSITELGSPSKDVDASTADTTVYYYDDNLNISTDSDVSAVRYYVILNHDDKIKTASAVLSVPDFSDEHWNYVPEEKPESYAYIENLSLDTYGYLTVTAYTNGSDTPKFTYAGFDTYNQALVAVEKELQSNVSLNNNYNYNSGYNYSGTSNDSLSVGRYYAFRFVCKASGGVDVVHKIIAVPQKIEDAYYLSIKSESRPHGYGPLYESPRVSIEDRQFGSAYYESVKIRWDVHSQDVRYYNIYRATSSDLPYDSLNFSFVTTKSNDSYYGYDEYTDNLQNSYIGLGNYVIYKVEPVGRYGVSSNFGTISTLALPAPTNLWVGSDNVLHWDAVDKAAYYYVYYARSQEALNAGEGERSCTSENSYSVVDSYTNGYYYAVKAYVDDSNESKMSSAVYVPKKVLESPVLSDVVLNKYSSYDDYTYRLSWYSSETYSSDKDYRIFYYSRYGTMSEETVKGYFENSPDSYQTDSVSFGTTTYDVSVSDTNRVHYYAVGTRAYDNDSGSYVYAISNVKKISWSGEISVSHTEGTTFDLTWSEIPGATQYRVYCEGSYSSSITNIGSYSPATYTNSTSYTYDNGDNYSYVFFFVVGVDDDGQEVGNTTVYRW